MYLSFKKIVLKLFIVCLIVLLQMFKQESKADINAARERARQPLKKLCDEQAMEIDAETFYPVSTGLIHFRSITHYKYFFAFQAYDPLSIFLNGFLGLEVYFYLLTWL